MITKARTNHGTGNGARATEQRLDAVTRSLSMLLADTYLLGLKTQNFHWNVTGVHFFALHEAFARQYAELAEAIDEIAERIRALDAHAPGSLADFSRLATVPDIHGHPGAAEMVDLLLADHETAVQTAHAALKAAQGAGDEATCDLLVRRIAAHQKVGWMLRSFP